jgi:spore germination protein YaaH
MINIASNTTYLCTNHNNNITATPYWECLHGSNTTINNNPMNIRQQGWYDDANSLQIKINLLKQFNIQSVGLWSANGISAGTMNGDSIWQLLKHWKSTR